MIKSIEYGSSAMIVIVLCASAHELVSKGCNLNSWHSHVQTTHLKHHTPTKNIIDMNVFNISKLSFYVLLLSVALAQILAVSAEENVDDVDGVTTPDFF